MDKLRIKLVVVVVVIAMIALLVIQSVHTKGVYLQETSRFSDKVQSTLYRVVIRHEKAEDIRHLFKLSNTDFNGHYKDILNEEYQNLLTTKDVVTITDTVIIENGVPENYIHITGEAQDSIGGVKAEQRVLARDIRKVKDFYMSSDGEANKDSQLNQLDQKVVLKMFEKARFINEMMVQAFRDNVIDNPEANLDLVFLDSVIRSELKDDQLALSYKFVITDKDNQILQSGRDVVNYDTTIVDGTCHSVNLYPRSLFNNQLKLNVRFTNQTSELLKVLWMPLLVNLLLMLIIFSALVYLFRTIMTQRKLAELKNDFISNMTHEFRTPISTISLACQAMEDPDMGEIDSSSLPYVRMIEAENKRLGILVDSILQSNTLEKGDIILKREKLLVNEVILEIVDKMKFKAQQKGGDVKLIMGNEMVYINADRIHFTNCISNLIANAEKYSPEVPEIELELKNMNKSISISVKDKGLGIKKEHVNKIFDKLYRVPTGNLHNVKGFGLGLSYVKAICDLHHWDISVQSKYGEGSTFTIEIKK